MGLTSETRCSIPKCTLWKNSTKYGNSRPKKINKCNNSSIVRKDRFQFWTTTTTTTICLLANFWGNWNKPADERIAAASAGPYTDHLHFAPVRCITKQLITESLQTILVYIWLVVPPRCLMHSQCHLLTMLIPESGWARVGREHWIASAADTWWQCRRHHVPTDDDRRSRTRTSHPLQTFSMPPTCNNAIRTGYNQWWWR